MSILSREKWQTEAQILAQLPPQLRDKVRGPEVAALYKKSYRMIQRRKVSNPEQGSRHRQFVWGYSLRHITLPVNADIPEDELPTSARKALELPSADEHAHAPAQAADCAEALEALDRMSEAVATLRSWIEKREPAQIDPQKFLAAFSKALNGAAQ